MSMAKWTGKGTATGKVNLFGSMAAVPDGRNMAVHAFTTPLSLFLGNL